MSAIIDVERVRLIRLEKAAIGLRKSAGTAIMTGIDGNRKNIEAHVGEILAVLADMEKYGDICWDNCVAEGKHRHVPAEAAEMGR